VDDRTKVLLGVMLGAVAGGVLGYLYLTDRGRRLRGRVEPQIDDLVSELTRLRQAVAKARAAADESWRTLQDVARQARFDEPTRPSSRRPDVVAAQEE
jgi:gas vesicle protein